MAIKLSEKLYKCPYCSFTDAVPNLVDAHRDSEHDILYVPFSREQLVKLIQYFQTGEKTLIDPDMYKTILQMSRYKVKPINPEDL